MSKATFDPTCYNPSDNTPFSEILSQRMSRRDVLKGTQSGVVAAAAASVSGTGLLALSGCANAPTSNAFKLPRTALNVPLPELNFKSIDGARLDAVVVPEGYTAQVLAPWGTPITNDGSAWQADGSNSAEDQANAMGMHHDGMRFFPLADDASDGLLCINHEYVDKKALHPDKAVRDAAFVRKEINAHGVSVVRVRLTDGTWQVVAGDAYNRRITAATPMRLSGPVAKSRLVQTAYDPAGQTVRGTLNNCGNGYTPWGTYLSCEENWPHYFSVARSARTSAHERLGIFSLDEGWYHWHDQAGDVSEVDGEFARFNLTPQGDSAHEDYRNEANGFGYVVEIDPYTQQAMPVKRTALGRFRHEGVAFGKLVAGQPVVFYSGHDGRFEYLYKFVSKALWNPADAKSSNRLAIGDKYLDDGVLYVARFDANGQGVWLPLTPDSPTPDGGRLSDTFESLESIIVHTQMAADLLGATPMDRPEWTTVDPVTGMVYASLTNNTKRTEKQGVNPANPRLDNAFGHIIRWQDSSVSTTFDWEIFAFGAPADADGDINRSGLEQANQFASPDGLSFDPRGILWIQTDNSAEPIASYTNDQMLAVVPAALADGTGVLPPITADNQTALKRFFVGPNGCEITGLAYTPDYTTFFVNVQHPDNWPYALDATKVTPAGEKIRPRSATVAIRRIDGGTVGA